jgi:hypothetical protein
VSANPGARRIASSSREQPFGALGGQLGLAVGFGVRRVGVDFEEDAVGAGGDRGARQRLGELALAAGTVGRRAGQLQRVGDVEITGMPSRCIQAKRACRPPGCGSRTRRRAR